MSENFKAYFLDIMSVLLAGALLMVVLFQVGAFMKNFSLCFSIQNKIGSSLVFIWVLPVQQGTSLFCRIVFG
jgi:hypothetical protein